MKQTGRLLMALVITVLAVGAAKAMPTGDPGGTTAFTPTKPAALEALDRDRPISAEQIRSIEAIPGVGLLDRAPTRSGLHGLDASFSWELDYFDGVTALDPAVWVSISDLNDFPDEIHWGEYFWELSDCRSVSPTMSLWAFGGGVDGESLACEDEYPSGAASSAIVAIDMDALFEETKPDSFNLVFDYWLNLRTFVEGGVQADGLFINYIMPGEEADDPSERVTIAAITSALPEQFFNDPWRVDMVEAQDVYDPEREPINITERGLVLMEFLALTRRPDEEGEEDPTTLPGGIFIDSVRLEANAEPNLPEGTEAVEISPTPLPTNTPTITPEGFMASPTPLPVTNTPTPTDTPVPSDTPVPPDGIYLPMLHNGEAEEG